MANWYCSSVDYTAVAQFAISHAYSIGDIVRQLATPSVGNERCFRCTTAGTSAGSEATWTLTKGATTTQGGAVFTEVTGNETYQSAGHWNAPHARVGNVSAWWASGDTMYVAANHNESTAASATIGSAATTTVETRVLCVDNSATGHVPPQAGDLRTTGVVSFSGSFVTLTIGLGQGYIYGLTFSAASGTLPGMSLGLASGLNRFEACVFQHLVSGTVTLVTGSVVEWIDCQWQPGTNTNSLAVSGAIFRWRNRSAMAAVLGTNALTGGLTSDSASSLFLFDGLDFSALAHGSIVALAGGGSIAVLRNCKLNASTAITGGAAVGSIVDAFSVDSGSNTNHTERRSVLGQLTTDQVVVHTSGASDGTTTIAWKVVTTASPHWSWPFEAFQIVQWNALTGSAKTVSFEAIANASAVLTNAQLWMDVDYLGTAAGVLSSGATSGIANALASAGNITASTQAWDSAATARANSHSYVAGDVIKLASNLGRVFFCTTLGTSASSEPGGYATAVDGGSVTDGTAVFRAGVRMTVSLSLTPQVAGLIRATPKVGLASTTLYIDPLLTIV